MTRIGDHNAATSFQLPATLPPRFAESDPAQKLNAANTLHGPHLRRPGERQSAEELKEAFTQFVGETFFSQMIKAMRSTVGKPAYFHGGRGEDVFQGRLDQQLAEHLTETTADQFTQPLFEHQFPHIAARPQNNALEQLDQLPRR